MEDFFKKLFKISEYEDNQDEQIELFKSSFEKSDLLNGKNIRDLQFLCIEDDEEGALFKFSNSNDIYRYYMFDPCWTKMCDRYIFKVGEQSQLDGVNLLENSSKLIEYVLYPFDQCNELPMKYLMTNNGKYLDTTLLKQIYCSDDENSCKSHYEVKWTNELTVVMGDNTYKILLNGKFLSGFCDTHAHFQLGDACTIVYTYGNDTLVIYQHGDVSSVVIIEKLLI